MSTHDSDRLAASTVADLRDSFAAKAMPALYAAALNDSVKESGVFSVPEWRYDSIARESYELADAMLKARGSEAERHAQPAAVVTELVDALQLLLKDSNEPANRYRAHVAVAKATGAKL